MQPPLNYAIYQKYEQMRPIVSSINSPVYLMSKWLQRNPNSFKQFHTYSVINRNDFIKPIKDTNIESDEYLISFDAVGLDLNVPINTSMELVEH